jgi:hypothetical protein
VAEAAVVVVLKLWREVLQIAITELLEPHHLVKAVEEASNLQEELLVHLGLSKEVLEPQEYLVQVAMEV